MQPIKKAIFPVAGLGTRFLPATKATPKEMLPIVDKPLIQYAVEEALAAGIEQLIFVTSDTKRSLEDHFDSNFELESRLTHQDKAHLLPLVRDIVPPYATCVYIRQPEARGLGHAVLCARALIGHEPFAVLLADDLIHASPPCLVQMLTLYEKQQSSVIAVQKIPLSDISLYGIAAINNESRITDIIEKPLADKAPSQWGVVGRYILSPAIFNSLEKTASRTPFTQEIQLTDGIAHLLKAEKVYAHDFKGKRYDCGSKLGYLEAIVEYALKHDNLSEPFKRYLKTHLPVL